MVIVMNPMLVVLVVIAAGVGGGLALGPWIRKRLKRAHAGEPESTTEYLTHPHDMPGTGTAKAPEQRADLS